MKRGVGKSTKVIVGLVITILFIFSLNISTLRTTLSVDDHSDLEHNILTLTLHNPIVIDYDFQFTSHSSSGSGTKSNPYIIENYNITTSDFVGIHIADTTRYFVIRNCFVEVEGFGITISNVAHGTASIVNNTINNCRDGGIRISSSSGVKLTNNKCNDTRYGIGLNRASSSIVVNNTCSVTDYGISIRDSPGSVLLNNTLYGGGLEFREYYWIEDFMDITVENNWVNEKRIGYYTNLTNSTFSDPLYGQLFLINCTETIVSNQTMSSINTGLMIRWCENITLINNTCSNSDTGIFIRDSSGSTLINNTCSNNYFGIYLQYSPRSSFTNNTCSNNYYGIFLYAGPNSSLVNNTCSNNTEGIGIYLSQSSGSVIINNSLVNDGFYISESSIDGYLGYYFENNKVNNKELGYFINLDEVTLLDPLYGQLFLINCTDSEVANQEIFNTSKGITLRWCENIRLANNTCTNNDEGFSLEYSSGLTIFNNTCNNNSIGMELSSLPELVLDNNTYNDNYIGINLLYSPDSIVNNSKCNSNYVGIWLLDSSSSKLINGVYSNSDHSIYIQDSYNSTLKNNTCNDDYVGIRLWYSSGSTLTNNTCNKSYLGIILEDSSESEIINNTCNENTCGIYLWNSDSCLISYNLLQENIEHGVCLDYTSDNNILHHNIFVDNNQGSESQAYDLGNNNTWFDAVLLEGNYWSDLGSNCTYEIAGQAEAIDPYPLNRLQDCNVSPSRSTLMVISITLSVFFGSAILLLLYRYYKPFSRKK